MVHFDNGWNSELAVKNIENIVSKLNYDLFTYVINWEEFKDLQISYLKASVVDIEVPTDYIIFAVLNKIAAKHNIKYILSGYNYVTEFGMPKGWNTSHKFDDINMRDIHKRFGKVKLKNFPRYGYFERHYYREIMGIETVAPLNLVPYNKKEIVKLIEEKLDWKDYGGKHYESIFTRFYQGYILPVKFNIDKRKAHLSTLICSGQISKAEALKELERPPLPPEMIKSDKEYVIKKFGFTEDEFNKIMNAPPVEHDFYDTEMKHGKWHKAYSLIMKPFVRILLKSRYIKATGKWRN